MWEEKDHPRDRHGRFSEKRGGVGTPRAPRALTPKSLAQPLRLQGTRPKGGPLRDIDIATASEADLRLYQSELDTWSREANEHHDMSPIDPVARVEHAIEMKFVRAVRTERARVAEELRIRKRGGRKVQGTDPIAAERAARFGRYVAPASISDKELRGFESHADAYREWLKSKENPVKGPQLPWIPSRGLSTRPRKSQTRGQMIDIDAIEKPNYITGQPEWDPPPKETALGLRTLTMIDNPRREGESVKDYKQRIKALARQRRDEERGGPGRVSQAVSKNAQNMQAIWDFYNNSPVMQTVFGHGVKDAPGYEELHPEKRRDRRQASYEYFRSIAKGKSPEAAQAELLETRDPKTFGKQASGRDRFKAFGQETRRWTRRSVIDAAKASPRHQVTEDADGTVRIQTGTRASGVGVTINPDGTIHRNDVDLSAVGKMSVADLARALELGARQTRGQATRPPQMRSSMMESLRQQRRRGLDNDLTKIDPYDMTPDELQEEGARLRRQLGVPMALKTGSQASKLLKRLRKIEREEAAREREDPAFLWRAEDLAARQRRLKEKSHTATEPATPGNRRQTVGIVKQSKQLAALSQLRRDTDVMVTGLIERVQR